MKKLIQYSKSWLHDNSPESLQVLQNYLNQSTSVSLDLQERIMKMDRSSGWDFEKLYESDELNICLLMVPKGNKIPLHTHPNMNVLLKCIWGHFLLSAYDWCEEFPFSGFAKQKCNKVVNGASPSTLISPTTNNIHQMIALEDCAFLDIVTPPYNEGNQKISYLKITEEFSYRGEDLVHFEIKI